MSKYLDCLKTVPPVSFFDMVTLEQHAHTIITDSGEFKKKLSSMAYHVSRLGMRLNGSRRLPKVVTSLLAHHLFKSKRLTSISAMRGVGLNSVTFGNGHAAETVVDLICSHF